MTEMIGQGSTYAIGTDEFSTLISISGPNAEVGTVTTTNLNSTVDTFLPTIVNNGTVTIACNWDPTDDGIVAAEALFVTPAVVTCTETTKDGIAYSYSAIFTGRQFEAAPDVRTLATVSYTIQVSGPITVTPAS